ncbi:MAG: helix-turn-helix transcriptional regulator [Actinomycetota bacterium]|nr:helix-turn-helix transcriptional regulator [Actinomycetota bacterium]
MSDKNTKNITRERFERCSCKSRKISRFLIPAILLLLSEKPSHGYELTEKYSKLGFTGAGSDPGAIYRTLKLLDKDGFIKPEWKTEESGPAKKIYSVTREGTELLSSWIEEIEERKKVFELFLKRYNKLK